MTDNRHRQSRQQRAAKLRADGHTHLEIAQAVGVALRTVERWQRHGVLPDCRVQPAAACEAVTLTEARRRRELARARMAEMEVLERQGELLEKAEVDEAYGGMLALVSSALDNAPGRFASMFGECPPREASDVLRRMVVEIKEHLSGPVADALEARADGGDLPDDCPARAALIAAGIRTTHDLVVVPDLQQVPGIGPATERRIRVWLEADFRAAEREMRSG